MESILHLSLPAIELINSETNEFVTLGGVEMDLEYSLYTVSLWESKWKKSFMHYFDQMGAEAKFDFYKCMCITPNVPDTAWRCMTSKHRADIFKFISDPMSATTITNRASKPGPKKIITTEQIYFWMAQLGIPFECEHWHFNRLMKLIQVGMVSNAPPKKMGRQEAAQLQQKVFAQNRAKYNSRG